MPSIAAIRTKYEVKRQNRFFLVFPVPNGDKLQFSVKASARPKWEVNDQELDYLNTKWWIAGRATWSEWSCTFYDYLDDNTLKALFTWYQIVYNPTTTGMQIPSAYKKDVMIHMLGPGLEDDIRETYTLYGAWPKSIDGGTLDMTQDGTVSELAVTFRYDYALLNV